VRGLKITKIRVLSDNGKLKVPTKEQLSKIAWELQKEIYSAGFECRIYEENPTRIDITNVRINPRRRGYNRSTWSGRRSRCLTWDEWVEVNGTVNGVLDEMQVSANVTTLNGKFKIRQGFRSYNEDDWEELKWENVGSVMNPITREEIYVKDEEVS